MGDSAALRASLVALALEWERRYTVAPDITRAIAEMDAARLVGLSDEQYQRACRGQTAVSRGADFVHEGLRYQVKGSRPSGRPGSKVTKLGKGSVKYDWDRLVWVLYNELYEVKEAWLWEVADYRREFESEDYIRPHHMQRGMPLESVSTFPGVQPGRG